MAREAERTYDEDEARHRLGEALSGWSVADGWLRRGFETDGWPTTLMLVNTIGFLAEAANHHPDLRVGWARVEVGLQTHSAGGITDKDVELARRIEEVALWRPAEGSALDGPAGAWVRGAGSGG